MSFSLSAADAELAELCPTELAALIARLSFSPLALPLSEVDAMLAALGEPIQGLRTRDLARSAGSAPANDVGLLPSRRPSVLPQRPSLPSMPRGSSPGIQRGSMPSLPLPPTRRDLSPVRAAARQSVVAAAESTPESDDTFVSAVAASPDVTQVSAPDSAKSQATSLRDADAEFDALLAEATSPQGLPVRKLLNAPANESDAQRHALEADDAVIDAVVGDARGALPSDVMALPAVGDDTSIDVPLDGDDATEVFDQQTYEAIARSLPPAAGDEEVDLSEFELEFDALTESDTEQGMPKPAPPPVPNAARGSSPTEQTPSDKRPSFLGRLFNRGNGESE